MFGQSRVGVCSRSSTCYLDRFGLNGKIRVESKMEEILRKLQMESLLMEEIEDGLRSTSKLSLRRIQMTRVLTKTSQME